MLPLLSYAAAFDFIIQFLLSPQLQHGGNDAQWADV